MFFCFGSPRSGTTLISQCLAAHPDILVPNETDFIVPAAFLYQRLNDVSALKTCLKLLLTKSRYFSASIGEYLCEAEVGDVIDRCGERLSTLLSGLYGAIAAKGGAQRAGDKSPNDIGSARIIEEAGGFEPPISIVHIVRDVRDVTASMIEQGWALREPFVFPQAWNNSNLYLNTAMANNERYILVRYEDFVADPEAHMRRLLAHLGFDFRPEVLDPTRRHGRFKTLPHHARLYKDIAADRIGSYAARMDAALISACEAQAEHGMARFGYAPAINASLTVAH
jgi:hypothetical protein